MKYLFLLALVAGCVGNGMADKMKTVVVWSEGTAISEIYPEDINGAIARGLIESGLTNAWYIVRASLQDPDQGVPDALLARTDVLIWWGHKKHGEVSEALAEKIEKRVKEQGMGFIASHSAHYAKPNKRLMGTACSFSAYKCDNKENIIQVAQADHPICKGVAPTFTIANDERYSDPYVVPPTAEIPLTGIQVHRDGTQEPAKMGYCWTIGKGRFFYLQVGHETNPIYFHPEIRTILANAVQWAAPRK